MGLRKVPRAPKRILAITAGIDNYKHWTRLQSAVQDAEVIKNMLYAEFDAPKVDEFQVRNEQATAARLRLLFKELLPQKIRAMGGEVGVFAFFACHGMVQNGRGFLIPVEAEEDPPLSSCLDIKKDFVDVCKAKGFPARAVFLAFATCHSGIALKDTWSEDDEEIHPVQILTAGKTAQSIPDSHPNQKNSLFTLALLDGLRGKAESGLQGDAISGSELIGFVRAEVYTKSRREGLPQDSQGGYVQTNSSGDEFFFVPNRPRFSPVALNYSEGNAEFRKSKIRLIIEEAEQKGIVDQAVEIISEIVETDSDLDVRKEGIECLGKVIWQHTTSRAPATEKLFKISSRYSLLRETILADLEKRGMPGTFKEAAIDEIISELKFNRQNDESLSLLGIKYADDKETLLKALEELGRAAPLLHSDKRKQRAILKLILDVLKSRDAEKHGSIARALETWLGLAEEAEAEVNPEFEDPPEAREIQARKEARAFWTAGRREKFLMTMIDSVQREPSAELLFEAQDGFSPLFEMLMAGTDKKTESRILEYIERALSASKEIEKQERLIGIASRLDSSQSRDLLRKILQEGQPSRDLRMTALYAIGYEYFDFDYGIPRPEGLKPILEIIKKAAESDEDKDFQKACKDFLEDIEAKRTPQQRWSEIPQTKEDPFADSAW